MDVDGTVSSHDGADLEFRVNAENVEPATTIGQQQSDPKKISFLDQVEKLTAVMINSEGPELNDAVTHVARNMSTFTAGERGDFLYELVIKFCEARREDQPKIDFLLKELGKKNVLAKPHFLQSARRLISETATLAVDWPNIYDCTVDLIGTNLSLLKHPTENLDAFGKLLNNAPPPADHAEKYLIQLRRHFPSVHVRDAKDGHDARGALPPRPAGVVGFFLSPDAAKDKFIRPVGLRSPSPPLTSRRSYSKEEMLAIELSGKSFSLPAGLLERVKIVKNDTWVASPPPHSDQFVSGSSSNQQGKRPRFVSESGTSGETGGTSTKRMLESTSPPLLMQSPHQRSGADWKYSGQRDTHVLSSPGTSLTGYDRPRFVSESTDKNSAFPTSPKKFYQEQPNFLHTSAAADTHHPHEAAGDMKPTFGPSTTASPSSSSATTAQPTSRSTPPRGLSGPGGKAPSSSGLNSSRPGSGGKTKKFLTALNVERITDTDSGQLSPTLSPNVKTWSRGSGSLNTFALKSGSGGTSPLKDANRTSPSVAIPSHILGGGSGNYYTNPRGSPGGSMGDHARRSPHSYRLSPGEALPATGTAKPDQPEQNWRRGLSQA